MQVIEVYKPYSGLLTRGNVVYAGVYVAEDARLFGADVIRVMLAKGFARVIMTSEPVDVFTGKAPSFDDDETPEPTTADEFNTVPVDKYDGLTNKELRAQLTERNIPIPEDGQGTGVDFAVVKKDLIRKLLEADGFT